MSSSSPRSRRAFLPPEGLSGPRTEPHLHGGCHRIPGRFRLFGFHLALVLDVFSRMPSPGGSSTSSPRLDRWRDCPNPRCTDSESPGTSFPITGRLTGAVFRRYLRTIGVQHRFRAVGRPGSIALIERFWRTLKDGLRARYSAPPLVLAQLEGRVRLEAPL